MIYFLHISNFNVVFFNRSVRNNNKIFGDIHIIAAGSFHQLPPVPSITDPGLYAFQSNKFDLAFPHKVNLYKVIHQDKGDLISAVHELCIGTHSNTTVVLMKSLSRPIPIKESTVHMFGTNFDIDMYNHDHLHQLNNQMHIFHSEDIGNMKSVKLCKMP